MKSNRTFTAVFALSLLIFAACETAEAPTQSQPQSPEETTSLEIQDVGLLAEAQNTLQATLQRGDAELAPNYGEFMNAVSDAATQLSEAINAEKAKGTDVSNFESILAELNGSLLRGDAELAPTYEEYYATVEAINSKLREAVEKL